MNAKTIQMAVGQMQVLNFHSPVCENISMGFEEMDLMSVSKAHLLYEFEIKISKSDTELKKTAFYSAINNLIKLNIISKMKYQDIYRVNKEMFFNGKN